MKRAFFVILIGFVFTAMSFSLALAGSGEDDGAGGKWQSAYCSGKYESHPILSYLATVYEVEEVDLKNYFCEGVGVGQIALALQTAEVYEEYENKEGYEKLVCAKEDSDVEDSDVECYKILLERREGGEGWGVIWKDLKDVGLKRKDAEKPMPPGQEKKDKDKDKDKNEDPDDPEVPDDGENKNEDLEDPEVPDDGEEKEIIKEKDLKDKKDKKDK